MQASVREHGGVNHLHSPPGELIHLRLESPIIGRRHIIQIRFSISEDDRRDSLSYTTHSTVCV